MKLLSSLVFAAALGASTAGAQSFSQGNVILATDLAGIANIASGFGSIEQRTLDNGEPVLVGRIDGVRYAIFFYGCAHEDGCNSIQFYASFDNSQYGPFEVNTWNNDFRYAKATVSSDGEDVLLRWSINMEGGLTRANLENTIGLWRRMLTEFPDQLSGNN